MVSLRPWLVHIVFAKRMFTDHFPGCFCNRSAIVTLSK